MEVPHGIQLADQRLHASPATAGAAIAGSRCAEKELQATLREVADLRAALDEHAIVAITDPRGRITYANDKFCAISKYSRDELLGQDHRLINSGHHPKEFMRNLWGTISAGKVWRGDVKNRARDGSFYWVATTIVPFLDAHGKPRQYVAIRADITARKQAEEEFHRLNAELERRVQERTAQLEAANKELEAFSYSVSHDLRAPLRAVDGFSRMLLEDYGPRLDSEGLRLIGVVRSEAQRMARLVDELLAFSRLGRSMLSHTPISMVELAQAAFDETSAAAPERRFQLRLGELPPAKGDAGMMRQVFINLFSNAVKFTRMREVAVIEASAVCMGHEIIYTVRDNGVGFDMRYVGKLFGVFQRLHRQDEFEGTGVGLALVQRIIQRHGGRIWAEGEPGAGAAFHFTLPAEDLEP
jgi:PAS domain S-box-containing protein